MASKSLNILFRVDASLYIGTGHVMRCLTLAKALKAEGAACVFVCRNHEGNLNDYIKAQGFAVKPLPHGPSSSDSHAGWLGATWQTDAAETLNAVGEARFDWLVVDHYALDKRWETKVHPICAHLMVIDDLADRPHHCALLLDQNLGRQSANYQNLTGSDCRKLIGPEFALLRPEFAAWRARSLGRRAKTPRLKTLLITLGGVDQHNITRDVLAALKTCTLPEDVHIKVIMGPHAPWLADVHAEAKTMPWPTDVLVGVSNMAELMAGSDLAIGAAGSTSWERCCLGLPTLALVLAGNQLEAARYLEKAGAIMLMGDTKNQRWKVHFADVLAALDEDQIKTLSQNSAKIVDGAGAGKCLQEMRI